MHHGGLGEHIHCCSHLHDRNKVLIHYSRIIYVILLKRTFACSSTPSLLPNLFLVTPRNRNNMTDTIHTPRAPRNLHTPGTPMKCRTPEQPPDIKEHSPPGLLGHDGYMGICKH